MIEEEATVGELQQAKPVEDQTAVEDDIVDDEDGEFFGDEDDGGFDDDELEEDEEFFDDDECDDDGEYDYDDDEWEDDEDKEPGTYKKVQRTTNDLNSIYRDGAAVAKELKGAYDDIKKLMDIRSLFKF